MSGNAKEKDNGKPTKKELDAMELVAKENESFDLALMQERINNGTCILCGNPSIYNKKQQTCRNCYKTVLRRMKGYMPKSNKSLKILEEQWGLVVKRKYKRREQRFPGIPEICPRCEKNPVYIKKWGLCRNCYETAIRAPGSLELMVADVNKIFAQYGTIGKPGSTAWKRTVRAVRINIPVIRKKDVDENEYWVCPYCRERKKAKNFAKYMKYGKVRYRNMCDECWQQYKREQYEAIQQDDGKKGQWKKNNIKSSRRYRVKTLSMGQAKKRAEGSLSDLDLDLRNKLHELKVMKHAKEA